jgi:hypothetical protein
VLADAEATFTIGAFCMQYNFLFKSASPVEEAFHRLRNKRTIKQKIETVKAR